jgi:pimeloyl-ACP methyl ester carboxylesterase
MKNHLPRQLFYVASLAGILAVRAIGGISPPKSCAPPTPRAELVQSLLRSYGQGPTEADIVDPKPTVVREEDMGDHVRQTIGYWVDKDEQVFGYLLLPKPRPKPGQRLPLVLCPHPTNAAGKDSVVNNYKTPPKDQAEAARRRDRQTALDLVRMGFVVFAPDRAGYGQRALLAGETSTRRQMDAYAVELKKRWPQLKLTTGKTVWDLQRALDFLVGCKFVDAERIGIIGHSLGAWDAMLLASVDERVKVCVANSGGTIHFDRKLWIDPEARREFMEASAGKGINQTSNLMLMSIAPRPFLHLRAINDSYEKGKPNLLEGYRLLVEYYGMASGHPEKEWHAPVGVYYHANEHGFEADARALAYQWIAMHLGLEEACANSMVSGKPE